MVSRTHPSNPSNCSPESQSVLFLLRYTAVLSSQLAPENQTNHFGMYAKKFPWSWLAGQPLRTDKYPAHHGDNIVTWICHVCFSWCDVQKLSQNPTKNEEDPSIATMKQQANEPRLGVYFENGFFWQWKWPMGQLINSLLKNDKMFS